jgi:hypothetical protein
MKDVQGGFLSRKRLLIAEIDPLFHIGGGRRIYIFVSQPWQASAVKYQITVIQPPEGVRSRPGQTTRYSRYWLGKAQCLVYADTEERLFPFRLLRLTVT